jgi:DNA-binding ferritin-like protein
MAKEKGKVRFDELAEHLEEDADELAERATALGGFATGTVRMAAMSTQISRHLDKDLWFLQAHVQD